MTATTAASPLTEVRLAEPLAGWERQVAVAIGTQTRLAVAYSGGVDSTVLLALAVRALGPDRTLAVLGVSPSLASRERADAHAVARLIGAPVVEVTTDEGEVAAYRANGPDRCFHCKTTLFATITTELVAPFGVSALAYGENADDARRPDRPGAQAATEHGVLRPLAAAGLGKRQVRELARALGLPNADKPAAPCLASRIPHFSEVTPRKLSEVERAEDALRELGFGDVRVRHHGEVARIELTDADLTLLARPGLRDQVRAAVRAAGFRFVAVDLAGIQSGAFTLPLVQRG